MSWLLSYLFNAFWQIPLLFAAAWVAARILRGATPHVEHRIWVGALLLQVGLPACNLRVAALWNALLGFLPSHSAGDSGGVHVRFGAATIAGNALHLPFLLEAGIVLAWACIVAYFALRLGWGIVQTGRLARSAALIDLPCAAVEGWTRHCASFTVSPAPQIAVSSQATGPVAIGLRRGIVLLPPDFLETVPAADLDAVLAHELAHIVRRDFAKNLLYSLLSLPIAWHPMMWRTRGHLADSRELICDEAAAAAVAGRRQYAQSLLRLASVFAGRPCPATLQAVGILDFSTANALERRVMNLTRKHTPLSTARRVLLAGGCSVLALATCTSALALHTDVSELAPDAQHSAPQKLRVSSAEMAGNKISGDNPIYPPEARKKKIQGKVVLDAVIGKDGTVERLSVVQSPDQTLSRSALDAVHTWRYRPYLLNGNPVEVETTINVTYNLEG